MHTFLALLSHIDFCKIAKEIQQIQLIAVSTDLSHQSGCDHINDDFSMCQLNFNSYFPVIQFVLYDCHKLCRFEKFIERSIRIKNKSLHIEAHILI